MNKRTIKDNMFLLGAVDWSRRLFDSLIPNLKVEVIDPVLCKGLPTAEAFESLDKMAAAIAKKHRQQGFA